MHKIILKRHLKCIKITHFVVFITFISFFSCKKETGSNDTEISRIEGQEININDSIATDQAIEDFVKPFREHIDQDLSEPLAYNPSTLSKTDGKLNTAIGNLMADIVMEQAAPVFRQRTGKDIDAVLLNFGGIRATMPKGTVTARTAYEVMPFENAIVVIELSADKAGEMMKYLVRTGTAHPISNMKLTLNKSGRLREALIAGKEITPERTYFIATSDYLMNGGDHMNFFLDPLSVTPLDYRIRNAMIDHFNKVDTIRTRRDDRFTEK